PGHRRAVACRRLSGPCRPSHLPRSGDEGRHLRARRVARRRQRARSTRVLRSAYVAWTGRRRRNGRHRPDHHDCGGIGAMTRTPKLYVPAITPFKADLSVDAERFIANCKALLDDGADGLAPFGTTSEANSMSVGERIEMLDMLIDSGVPADR